MKICFKYKLIDCKATTHLCAVRLIKGQVIECVLFNKCLETINNQVFELSKQRQRCLFKGSSTFPSFKKQICFTWSQVIPVKWLSHTCFHCIFSVSEREGKTPRPWSSQAGELFVHLQFFTDQMFEPRLQSPLVTPHLPGRLKVIKLIMLR